MIFSLMVMDADPGGCELEITHLENGNVRVRVHHYIGWAKKPTTIADVPLSPADAQELIGMLTPR